MIKTETVVRKSKKRKRRKILFCFGIVFICLLFIITYIDEKLDPLVCLLAEQQTKNRITQIINQAASRILEEEGAEYEELVRIRYGTDGRITSLTANTAKLTALQTKLTSCIIDDFFALTGYTVEVSFSNIMDDEVFFGRFPKLNMPATIDNASSVESEIISEFQSAGINQTLHKISLQVVAHVCVLTLITNITFDMTTSVPLAETLIVGDIPAVYLS